MKPVYLAPDLEVNSESEPFESGAAIVKGWEHPSLPPDHPDFRADMKAATGARFVLTGPPRVTGRFPVIYAWPPMHGNAHGIARRNNDDRGRVHAILQAVDALLEKENLYLINYGIEGTHWTLGDNNRPQWTEEFAEDGARSGLGLGVLGRSVPLGLDIFAILGDPDWIDSGQVNYLNDVRFSPNGILGSNNVCVVTQNFVNAVEGGTDLLGANGDLLGESATPVLADHRGRPAGFRVPRLDRSLQRRTWSSDRTRGDQELGPSRAGVPVMIDTTV